MIEWSVKARLGAAVVAVLLVLTSCARRNAPSAEEAALAPVQAGAQGWDGGALLLPAASPAVFTARLDEMLGAVGRLKKWVLADPAMLGPDCPNLARTIDRGWIAATAYIGVDPLLPAAWVERGIDPGRPMYAGFYPVEATGNRFSAALENVLREELGIAPGASVSDQLHQLAAVGAELPEGTHARIARAVPTQSALRGGRVVLPITLRDDFLATATALVEGLGYRPFSHEVRTSERELCFWSPSGSSAVSIRFVRDHAVIDVLFPAFGHRSADATPSGAELESLHARLQEGLALIPSGRPHAPTPVGAPAIAVSFDQRAMGNLVRLVRYEGALDEVASTASQRRDAELLQALVEARAEVDAWEVGDSTMTGTSFQLDVAAAEAATVGAVSMTLFGRRDLPLVDTTRVAPTLDLRRRSIALAVDLGMLRSDAWQAWFAGETGEAVHALEIVEGPASSFIPWVRAAAMLASNLGDPPSARGVAADLAEVVEELDGVARVEIVGLGRDLAELRRVPRFVVAVTLEGAANAAAVAQSQAAILGGVAALLGPVEELPDVATPLLTPGATVVADVAGLPVAQHLLAGPPSALVLGIGLAAAELDAEIAAIGAARPVGGAFVGRLEPIALLSLLRGEEPDFLDPIDLDILAQRLGAVSVRYGTAREVDTPAMTLRVTLEAPPTL